MENKACHSSTKYQCNKQWNEDHKHLHKPIQFEVSPLKLEPNKHNLEGKINNNYWKIAVEIYIKFNGFKMILTANHWPDEKFCARHS